MSKFKCPRCGLVEVTRLCEFCNGVIPHPRSGWSDYCKESCGASARQKRYRDGLREKARKYDEEHRP